MFPSPARLVRRVRRLVPAAIVLAAVAGGFAQLVPNAPIPDFHLPVFDAATGTKTYDLRGASAIYHSPQLVELNDFVLRGFTAGETLRFEVQSPKAMLHVPERVAEGDQSIHAHDASYDLTGRDWRWEERENHIVVRQDVRVTINASLGSFLK